MRAEPRQATCCCGMRVNAGLDFMQLRDAQQMLRMASGRQQRYRGTIAGQPPYSRDIRRSTAVSRDIRPVNHRITRHSKVNSCIAWHSPVNRCIHRVLPSSARATSGPPNLTTNPAKKHALFRPLKEHCASSKSKVRKKRPLFAAYPRILWRLKGSGAVSEAAKSEKHPYFALCLDFLGVLEEAALSLKPRRARNAHFLPLIPIFWAFWKRRRCL